MSENFQKNILAIKKSFSTLASPEEKYHFLIEMGSKLSPFPSQFKTEENLVSGCQSRLYLHSFLENGSIAFLASADALVSAGLAALLISAYDRLPPETLFQCPPDFLQELGIQASLSLNRSNGLANIYLKMKKDAIRLLTKK